MSPRQIYGYTVCLVCVIGFLVSVPSSIKAWHDFNNPLLADSGNVRLTSFEVFQSDELRRLNLRSAEAAELLGHDLRQAYDASVTEHTERIRFQSRKSLTANGVLAIACIVLFLIHIFWLRKSSDRVGYSTGRA